MIDLHLHLDGALSPESVRQLAEIEKVAVPKSNNELLRLMRLEPYSKDFNAFFNKFNFTISLLQCEQSIATAVYNLCEELKNQGIKYAEIRYAPQNHNLKGMSQEESVVAAIEGLRKSTMRANLILCCMRTEPTAQNVAKNMETVALVGKYLGKGVCGADLAGPEANQSTESFREVFEYARELQVPFEIHAGESCGAQSVWQALELGAWRIGHGVRSVEDPALVKELAKRKTPLMVCPTSNYQTDTVKEIKDLPVRRFIDEGVHFTINTDDPSIEGTDLSREWQIAKETFNLSKEEIRRIRLNAVDAAFCSARTKEWLRNEMEGD